MPDHESPGSRPRDDLAALAAVDVGRLPGVPLPPRGRLGALLLTSRRCDGCDTIRRRLGRLGAAIAGVAEVDVKQGGGLPDVLPAISTVPCLVLYDAGGNTVGVWVGTPLVGAIERTVQRWGGPAT